MKSTFTRLRFLQDTAAAGLAAPFLLRSSLKAGSPNGKLSHACIGGEKTESHFAQTGPMTEAILLGTVAISVPDQKLVWGAPRMRFPNHPEAERFPRRKYRDGWEVHPV